MSVFNVMRSDAEPFVCEDCDGLTSHALDRRCSVCHIAFDVERNQGPPRGYVHPDKRPALQEQMGLDEQRSRARILQGRGAV